VIATLVASSAPAIRIRPNPFRRFFISLEGANQRPNSNDY
jgi:hypothetical protein